MMAYSAMVGNSEAMLVVGENILIDLSKRQPPDQH
jgi:hypothetical protein